jgi:RNA polymerase sigma-70 factor (ECF subfamily)
MVWCAAMETSTATHQAVEAVWKMESARLIAGLARMLRDVSLAEELAHDALVAALLHWPGDGVPKNPGAWLMTTAKRAALDYFRRNKMAARKLDELARDLQEDEQTAPDLDAALDDDVGDDLLGLIFTACHPAVSTEARTALTLRLLGGLTTDEIARAFLTPEPTIAQRIVRAKRLIAEARLPYEPPRGGERTGCLPSVLEVIYLIFNEGYSATSGADLTRPALCNEALRLGRILARLMPDETEVHGLVALMEIQASRLPARVGEDGQPILLLDQNRSLWDQLMVRRGLAALAEAEKRRPLGTYGLQGAIAACHVRARKAADTDWPQIAALYDLLLSEPPSPVVGLNRAVAHGMAFGPTRGLQLIDELADEDVLRRYHLLPAARADLLFKVRRMDEARTEFERAAAMTDNARERDFLLDLAKKAAN